MFTRLLYIVLFPIRILVMLSMALWKAAAWGPRKIYRHFRPEIIEVEESLAVIDPQTEAITEEKLFKFESPEAELTAWYEARKNKSELDGLRPISEIIADAIPEGKPYKDRELPRFNIPNWWQPHEGFEMGTLEVEILEWSRRPDRERKDPKTGKIKPIYGQNRLYGNFGESLKRKGKLKKKNGTIWLNRDIPPEADEKKY